MLGRKPPRVTMPTVLLKASAPLGPVVGPAAGLPAEPARADLLLGRRDVLGAATTRPCEELGYAPRPLEQGLRDTLAAEGWLPAK